MPTFLELCQQMHSDCKVGGTIASVTGQTGMLLRVVNDIKKANRKIQRRKSNWKFLWAQKELTLVNQSVYTPPDNLSLLDEQSFWAKAGTSDARHIKYVDWKTWRDVYQHQFTEEDEVAFVTVRPDGNLAVLPHPDTTDQGTVITFDYWKSPVDLSANSQVSVIPEQFHDAIITQAKQYFFERMHNTGRFNAAYSEHELIYAELKAHSLPGQEEERKSEASNPMVITVE